MTKSAGKRKRGRPFKPAEETRVLTAHRVLPATLTALTKLAEQSGESRGELLDRLVAKEHKRVMRKENQ
jgi:hypothetical protein